MLATDTRRNRQVKQETDKLGKKSTSLEPQKHLLQKITLQQEKYRCQFQTYCIFKQYSKQNLQQC